MIKVEREEVNGMNYTNSERNNKKTSKGGVILIATVILGVILVGFIRQNYLKSHFARNTMIQGVDCSYFDIPKATEAIAEVLDNEKITLICGETTYEFQGKDFGLRMSDSKELEEILASQQGFESGQEYTIKASLIVEDEKVEKCLSGIKELQKENMVKPQNAYIVQEDDGMLRIESEVMGNEVEFEEAVAMCKENLIFGETTIDFNLIANVPEVSSKDEKLNANVTAINHILDTVINLELTDGSIVILDKTIMKSWVCVDESGEYYVDGEKITAFVEELNERVKETGSTLMFTPSDHSPIALPVEDKRILSIDIEKETQQILGELEKSGTYTRMPNYEQEIDMAEFESYVEIDISRQKVWFYYKGECILDGVPCVTGNAGNHDTPPGVFYLKSKSRNAVLRGWNDNGTRYASPVKVWMPFNGGIGMHDASWKTEFGGEIYKTNGSHGCVNMRLEDAEKVYEYIDKTMPIIVYKSENG